MLIYQFIQKKRLICILFLSLGYTSFSVLFTYQIKNIMSCAETTSDFDEMLIFACTAMICIVCSCMLLYWQQRLSNKSINDFKEKIRESVFDSILDNSYGKSSKLGFAEISTSIIQDTSSFASLLYDGVCNSLSALLYWIVVLVVMLVENTKVTLLFMLIVVCLAVGIFFFRKSLGALFKNYAAKRSMLNSKINEILKCKNIINSFEIYDIKRAELISLGNSVKNDYLKCNVTTPIVFSSIEIAILVSYIIIFGSLQLGWHFLALSVPQCLLFIGFIPQLWSRFSSLLTIYSNLVAAKQYANRIEEKLKIDIQKNGNDRQAEIINPTHIEISELQYSFDELKVIDNLNFSYSGPGIVYVVGKSGAGKSTLFNIFTGLYSDYKGSVRLDGIEIKKISKASIEKCVGIVYQLPYIITGTAFENIRLFDLNITKERIQTVAQKYRLSDYMPSLDNTEFTRCEARIISILRVLVRNPDILLFDEVTADLDSYTENVIHEVIKQLSNEKLCFVIEHKSGGESHKNEIKL